MANGSPSQENGHNFQKVKYQHAIVEGTSYEVGRVQGEFIKQAGWTLIPYAPPEPKETARKMRHSLDEYCPGLTEEIQGVADSLALPFETALFCATTGSAIQGCTHAVALPAITANQHLLVARNYDMQMTDTDLRLCTTRIQSQFSHIGFSDMCTGRLDGLNQHGLCVTLSATPSHIPEDWQLPDGLHYAIAVRAALDQCKNLEEAIGLWQRMPIGSTGTLLASDRSGMAASVEIAGKKRVIKRIGPSTKEQHLVAANHFTLIDFPDRSKHYLNSHSIRRYKALTSWLMENQDLINCDELMSFLDRDWDSGVSFYSPEHKYGTLWSMVFDVTAGTVEIRFGPPPQNRWHSFTLGRPIGACEYTAEFPIKRIGMDGGAEI